MTVATELINDGDGVTHLRDNTGLLCGLDFMPGLVRLPYRPATTSTVTCEGCQRAIRSMDDEE